MCLLRTHITKHMAVHSRESRPDVG
jgi:hypothetical protein